MFRLRSWQLVLILVATAFLLGGCGSDDGGSESTSESERETTQGRVLNGEVGGELVEIDDGGRQDGLYVGVSRIVSRRPTSGGEEIDVEVVVDNRSTERRNVPEVQVRCEGAERDSDIPEIDSDGLLGGVLSVEGKTRSIGVAEVDMPGGCRDPSLRLALSGLYLNAPDPAINYEISAPDPDVSRPATQCSSDSAPSIEAEALVGDWQLVHGGETSWAGPLGSNPPNSIEFRSDGTFSGSYEKPGDGPDGEWELSEGNRMDTTMVTGNSAYRVFLEGDRLYVCALGIADDGNTYTR